MTRARDSQRSAVYAWERKAISDHARLLGRSYSKAEARDLLDTIWREQATRFGKSVRKPPALKYRSRVGLSSYYRPRTHTVAISHTELWVLLHEIAHALTYESSDAWHGARFCAAYIMLLTLYGHADHDQLRASAAECGVKVLDRFRVESSLAQVLKHHLPWTVIDLAVATNRSYREIQGAMISLVKKQEVIRRGKVYRSAA